MKTTPKLSLLILLILTTGKVLLTNDVFSFVQLGLDLDLYFLLQHLPYFLGHM